MTDLQRFALAGLTLGVLIGIVLVLTDISFQLDVTNHRLAKIAVMMSNLKEVAPETES